jgi:hypothetical protein
MITGADRRTIEQLTQELEEQRELASNRLAELVCFILKTLAELDKYNKVSEPSGPKFVVLE